LNGVLPVFKEDRRKLMFSVAFATENINFRPLAPAPWGAGGVGGPNTVKCSPTPLHQGRFLCILNSEQLAGWKE
jgi:hypothetical protein